MSAMDEERYERLAAERPCETAEDVEREAQRALHKTNRDTERAQRKYFRDRTKAPLTLWGGEEEFLRKIEAMKAEGGDVAEFAEALQAKAGGRMAEVWNVMQQMRFTGLAKALNSWMMGHRAVCEAKEALMDAFHNMCVLFKVPTAGSSSLDKFIFSNTADALSLKGLNWNPSNLKAFVNVLRGVDLAGGDHSMVPLMRLRERCDAPFLQHLIIESNPIEAEGARMLVEGIVECGVPLKSLDIAECRLGEAGAYALVDLLCAPDLPLETLVADSNQLGDGGVAAIVDVVASAAHLSRLSLRKNTAGKASGKSFKHMLGETETLVVLDVAWNELRGDAAVHFCEGLANNRSLKELNLSWNAMGDSKCMAALATALHDCNVEAMDLSENRIGPKACFVFANALQHNAALKGVRFDGNPITMQGGRELLRCALHGKDGKEVMRSISLENCAMGTVAPSVFNPAEPAGSYVLDMTDNGSARILRNLIKLTHEGAGELRGAVLVVATPEGEVRKPFDVNGFNADQGSDNWQLPDKGFVEVEFADTRVAPSEEKLGDDIMHSLREQLAGNIAAHKKVDVVQAAMGMSQLSFDQMLELLAFIPENETQERVNLVCRCYHRLSGMDDPRKALDVLATEEKSFVEKQLGAASFTFFRNNPTGFHRLDLAQPAQREVLLRLVGLKNAMSDMEEGMVKYYQKRGRGERDVLSLGLSWRNARFNHNPIAFSQSWSVPYGGMFDVDFVDLRRPDHNCAAMSEEEFEEAIMSKWRETSALLGLYTMSPNSKLKLLREVTNSCHVCCDQVARMVKQFSPHTSANTRVEIVVSCWARTVDWHGLANVMLLLTPFEQKVVMNRLGPVNVFDEIMAVGYYELDLQSKTDRFIFQELLHLSTSEPGDNLLHVTFNTLDFTIPLPWLTGEGVPLKGKISFYFVRSAEVQRRIIEQGPYGSTGAGKPPPHSVSAYAEDWWRHYCEEGFTSPTGSDWVYPYRCRRIRHKLAEKFDQIEHCFGRLDHDGSGCLDRREITTGLFELGIWLHPQESRQFLEQLDDDGSGTVSIGEFQKFWTQFAP
uniref:EF-hand domain-containing protein n=2 Tax=Hemiselmis andersenii TaxID=464988 RepID=A0A7S1MV82_HEMAN